jgi:DNA polymerase III alpha subunit (gram-positive type)
MKRYVVLDVETGGIGDDKSLLTADFIYCQYQNNEFEILDCLSLKIKPNDGVYRVTAESLSVNGINLIEHDKIAITEKQAGTKVYDRLSSWYILNKKEKLIPIGHNVAFDIRNVTTKLVNPGTWEQFVSYKALDTSVIAQFLQLNGKIPVDVSCSLINLTNYFNCEPLTGKAHQSDYDCIATLNVLENLFNIN